MRSYLDRAWIHEEMNMKVMIVVINIGRKDIQSSAMNFERREEMYHDAISSNVRFGSRISDD